MLKDTFRKLTLDYIDEERDIQAHQSIFDGKLGLGGGTKTSPCHENYVKAINEAAKDYVSNPGEESETLEAAQYLLSASHNEEATDAAMFTMIAAQSAINELIPLLGKESRAALGDMAEKLYPKRTRLPLQIKLYKLFR